MVRNGLSIAAEDYLKAIYHLTNGQTRASTNEIAEKMGVGAGFRDRYVAEVGRHRPATGRVS